jgi:hypothetical protein
VSEFHRIAGAIRDWPNVEIQSSSFQDPEIASAEKVWPMVPGTSVTSAPTVADSSRDSGTVAALVTSARLIARAAPVVSSSGGSRALVGAASAFAFACVFAVDRRSTWLASIVTPSGVPSTPTSVAEGTVASKGPHLFAGCRQAGTGGRGRLCRRRLMAVGREGGGLYFTIGQAF